MKFNDNEIVVGQHVVEIGEQKLGVGLNEPDYVDLTLTVNDGDHEIVITGMDDEMEGFAKAILAALKAKQDRQAAEDEEEQRQWERDLLPKKSFRLTGVDIGRAVYQCDRSTVDNYDFLHLEDDLNEIILHLPDDQESVQFLDWLADAYCVEWEAVEK